MHKIRVDVETAYRRRTVRPEASTVTSFPTRSPFATKGKVPARLLTRHWIITDANGKVQEVRGEGVVGEQPYLKPGQGFRYSSGAVIETPVGCHAGQLRDDRRRRHAASMRPSRPSASPCPESCSDPLCDRRRTGLLSRSCATLLAPLQLLGRPGSTLVCRRSGQPRPAVAGECCDSCALWATTRSRSSAITTCTCSRSPSAAAASASPTRWMTSSTAPDRDELLEWLHHTAPVSHPSDGDLMVHAGLVPQWTVPWRWRSPAKSSQRCADPRALFDHMYGDQPTRWSDDLPRHRHGCDSRSTC